MYIFFYKKKHCIKKNITCYYKRTALLFLINFFSYANGQFTSSSDRSQQELNLLSWATGIRMAYCQATPIADLINPFKEAIARMINRFCRNATACKLKKTTTFTKHQVVILDGFPKRENRVLNFRFFVVFPHDAIPIKKRVEKPLISQKVLSDILETQLSELTHGLGWQILSYERYPRFDPLTTFMNHTIIFILPIAFLCMLFLAYWSSTITSGSSLYNGEGWMVTGSTGGKNAALRRTLEIIEKQKYCFDSTHRESLFSCASKPSTTAFVVYKSNSRLQQSIAPPRSLATSSIVSNMASAQRAAPLLHRSSDTQEQNQIFQTHNTKKIPKIKHQNNSFSTSSKTSSETVSNTTTRQKSLSTTPSFFIAKNYNKCRGQSLSTTTTQTAFQSPKKNIFLEGCNNKNNFYVENPEALDIVPEIVVMRTRNASMETNDTNITGGRKISLQGHRRISRHISTDDLKRKKSTFGRQINNATSRPKRWKAGSLMFSRFSFKRPK